MDQQPGLYDHCWVLGQEAAALRPVARLSDSSSGRTLEVLTTEPGIQIYTGGHLSGVRGARGAIYERCQGICLETQHFPNSPNVPQFPSTRLLPGENYRSITVYRFGTLPA